ncbi:MAG: phosphotransferase [Myxococcales bacterium]|nr:phosphotransferase [Myxococcales bacterium]
MSSEIDTAFRVVDERTASRRIAAWVDAGYAADLRALGLFDPGRLAELFDVANGPRGRAPTTVLELPGRGEHLHLRLALHGGWLRPLLRDAWPGLGRQHAELETTRTLRRDGAPVPRPLVALGERRRSGVWRVCVGTLHVANAPNAATWLADRDADAAAERIARAASAAGEAVRRFHDAGGSHRDLHLGNLLVQEDAAGNAPRVLVIDLDRASAGAPPDAGRRMAELMRLFRSAVKRGIADRLAATGIEAFTQAYTRGEPALQRALERTLPRETARLNLHRLGYSLASRLAS